ncbi:hypothetical protein [Nonomuraea polychroma]|uniref:hypothetical protein n=1 Tax=Nonomuraea polychroma TaxID=46176 RepID=UPI000FDEAB5B|nr:hypothetical protein [Nonomuraea polychroma]
MPGEGAVARPSRSRPRRRSCHIAASDEADPGIQIANTVQQLGSHIVNETIEFALRRERRAERLHVRPRAAPLAAAADPSTRPVEGSAASGQILGDHDVISRQ